MTIDQRLELAQTVRSQGYNCAQSVMAAFPDVFTLPQEVTLRLGGALGAGMGSTGGVCGVLSAMALAEGMRTQGLPGDKVKAGAGYHKLHDDFLAEHGATSCPALKALSTPCNDLIAAGIRQYHNYLADEA